MATNLLLPLDGSDLAQAAVPYAERLGQALGWGVVLLRVLPHDPGGDEDLDVAASDMETVAAVDDAIAENGPAVALHRRAAALERLAPVAARLRAAGLAVESQVSFGPAAEVIADRAGADDVALVVLASHGRTGLARLFRGSVAQAVVAHAGRPTLVVHPFGDETQRVHLEHADRLPAAQADAVRQAVAALAP